MALDALGAERPVRCKAGALASVDLYWRNQTNAALLQGVISTWDFRVYDEQGNSPETAIYTDLAKAADAENANGTDIFLTAAAITGASRLAIGHTMLHYFDPVALFDAREGSIFTLEYKANLTAAGTGPAIARVALVIEPAYQ